MKIMQNCAYLIFNRCIYVIFSSISQPYNPDVVIADTDDEEEFAEIQRGTQILKSVSSLWTGTLA